MLVIFVLRNRFLLLFQLLFIRENRLETATGVSMLWSIEKGLG